MKSYNRKTDPAIMAIAGFIIWALLLVMTYLILVLVTLPFTRSVFWFGSPLMWWVIVNAYIFARIVLFTAKMNKDTWYP